MDLGLKDKIALVAASSAGIGHAVALGLAREGAGLVICGRDRQRLDAAADRVSKAGAAGVLAVQTDLCDPQGPEAVVSAALERFGRVDILVTNTGGPPSMPCEDVRPEQWPAAFNQLFMSAQRLIAACLPGMKQRGWGRVVAITSTACTEPIDGLALSNSVRVSIHGLLKTLSKECGAHGITFNAVQPGFTWTDRVQELAAATAGRRGVTVEQVIQSWFGAIPLGRAATPEEVASAAVYLASQPAAFVNGVSLRVDGGRGAYIF